MNSQDIITSLPPAAGTVPKTAQYMGLGESTVWKLIREKKLPAVRIGRRTLVRFRDADVLLAPKAA